MQNNPLLDPKSDRALINLKWFMAQMNYIHIYGLYLYETNCRISLYYPVSTLGFLALRALFESHIIILFRAYLGQVGQSF